MIIDYYLDFYSIGICYFASLIMKPPSLLKNCSQYYYSVSAILFIIDLDQRVLTVTTPLTCGVENKVAFAFPPQPLGQSSSIIICE